jgi:hypothetical protein
MHSSLAGAGRRGVAAATTAARRLKTARAAVPPKKTAAGSAPRAAPSRAASPPPDPSSRPLRRARALLEQRAPPESFHVRGVTFDGRQKLIERLHPGEPVCLSKEPWNKFDGAAVRISSLRGEHLGYVDRRCTGSFAPRERVYGFVDSVGRVVVAAGAAGAAAAGAPSAAGAAAAATGAAAATALGPWGARVVAWPFLAAPLPDVLPEAMADEADRRLGLRFAWESEDGGADGAAAAAAAPPPPPPPPRWQRLAAAALARARGVCEATGLATNPGASSSAPSPKPFRPFATPTAAPAAAPLTSGLVALPEWRFDEARRAVVLAGAVAVCPQAARCVRASRIPATRRAERAAALGLAMDLMRWDVKHMREYLETSERRADECARDGWALDLGEEEEE